MEVLETKGVNIIPFSFPESPGKADVRQALERLSATLGTNLTAAEKIREKLSPTRHHLEKLDEATWQDGTVSGFENHLWLVTSSDFNQDLTEYQRQLDALLASGETRLLFQEGDAAVLQILPAESSRSSAPNE